AAARDRIATLAGRIDQLARDIERETALNRDAGDTIERLEWEARELSKAGEGHEARLEAASDGAHEAASVLQEREAALSEMTEDVARLAARHQSAQRFLQDSRKTLEKSETEADRARDAVQVSRQALETASEGFDAATTAEAQAQEAARAAEAALAAADEARAEAQAREADARAERS
ncbi:MAG TPA: chromosome segregation protein SMC, partial [Roseovarius nubinhibens]|nr:chromosome segregation protein SMC [Roseovarius nubinhibens]